MKKASFTILAFLSAGVTWSQPTAALSFEVASVKAVPPNEQRVWQRPVIGPDRVELRNVTLWYCLSYAYGMKSYSMFGPDWLRQARYDIVAKAPAGTPREDLPKMMRTLLAERFQANVHQETREIL